MAKKKKAKKKVAKEKQTEPLKDRSENMYKSSLRSSPIPPCTLDLKDLEKLFEIIKELNAEAIKIELDDIEDSNKQSATSIPKKDLEKMKADVTGNLRINIEISGIRGEFISSDSSSVFQKRQLPDCVTSIIFNNTSPFHNMFDTDPCCAFELELDYSKPRLIDIAISPSSPITNTSNLQVLAVNSTWAEGAYEKIMSFLKKRQTYRTWLYSTYIYNLFMYVICIPLSFWILHKIELFAANFFGQCSVVLTVAIYLYLFILLCNFFMFMINYFCWLFPYQELQTSPKSRIGLHRVIFFLVVTAITGALAVNFFTWLINLVF